jgi:tyrosyl-tRNA synthetase
VEVKRPSKFGGDLYYETFEELTRDFAEGGLHPMDLKKTAASYINSILDPVRAML